MMRASCSGVEDEDTMGFDGGAGASEADGAVPSPGLPRISSNPINDNNRKIFIKPPDCEVLNGEGPSQILNMLHSSTDSTTRRAPKKCLTYQGRFKSVMMTRPAFLSAWINLLSPI